MGPACHRSDLGGSVDADEQYILDRLMDGYTPGRRRPPRAREGRWAQPPTPRASQPLTATRGFFELLDEYEQAFFSEGRPVSSIQKLADEWRTTGLDARDVPAWLDAGVYESEPDLAAGLAAAGFTPQQARRTMVRFSTDGPRLSILSWVRGRTDRAAGAQDLANQIAAAKSHSANEQAG